VLCIDIDQDEMTHAKKWEQCSQQKYCTVQLVTKMQMSYRETNRELIEKPCSSTHRFNGSGIYGLRLFTKLDENASAVILHQMHSPCESYPIVLYYRILLSIVYYMISTVTQINRLISVVKKVRKLKHVLK